MIRKFPSHSIVCFSTFLFVTFDVQKFLVLKSSLPIFSFLACAASAALRKPPIPGLEDLHLFSICV